MGSAPAAAGFFATLEGGYLRLDQADVLGHAVNPTGVLGAAVDDREVSPDAGYFAGGSIGWRAPAPFVSYLALDRVEIYLANAASSDRERDGVTGVATIDLHNVDTSTLARVGYRGETEIERTSWELGVRLASDQGAPGVSSLTWVLQPFLRMSEEATDTVALGTADTAWRSADVETRAYGLMALVEPEHWLSPSLAIVGRAGAGVYAYDIDGEFQARSTERPDIFAASVSGEASGIGLRALIGAGVKLKLDDAATLTGFVEGDYLSDAGTARLPDATFASSTSADVDVDEVWEFRAGARVSLKLDGSR